MKEKVGGSAWRKGSEEVVVEGVCELAMIWCEDFRRRSAKKKAMGSIFVATCKSGMFDFGLVLLKLWVCLLTLSALILFGFTSVAHGRLYWAKGLDHMDFMRR